jgi:hypothetical protein
MLSLALKAVAESIPVGTVPVFQLTIKNVGEASERILKPRGDLQDTYYDLEVMKDGQPLMLPRAISDPGPLSDEDYITLEAGRTVIFRFTWFALAVHNLPPGDYEARIRFFQEPAKSTRPPSSVRRRASWSKNEPPNLGQWLVCRIVAFRSAKGPPFAERKATN